LPLVVGGRPTSEEVSSPKPLSSSWDRRAGALPLRRGWLPLERPVILAEPQHRSYCLPPRSSLSLCFLFPHGLRAFSALLVLRKSRNFKRALCNCDLLLPIEPPTIPAIAVCSYPSTSCNP